MDKELESLLNRTKNRGLGPLVESDDIDLFHNEKVIYFSIRNTFDSWITIYNKDPKILEEEYPDIMRKIKNTYLNTNNKLEINEDTPDIIKRDPDVIKEYFNARLSSIFGTFTEKDDLELLGKIIGKQCYSWNYSFKAIENLFNENASGLLYSDSLQKGLIEECPSFFLTMRPTYISYKYYETLRQVFLDNFDKVDTSISVYNMYNAKIPVDTVLLEFIFKKDPTFALKITDFKTLYKNNKEFIIRMFKENDLTIDEYCPSLIKSDSDIQLISFKNNPESIKYFRHIKDREIIQYIIDNQLEDAMEYVALRVFEYPEIQEAILEDEEVIEKDLAKDLIQRVEKALHKGISPENMKTLVMDYAIEAYEHKKREEAGMLANVRPYLFSVLKSSEDIVDFVKGFGLYYQFEKVFGQEFKFTINDYYANPNNIEIQNRISDYARRFGDLYKQHIINKVYEDTIKNIKRDLYTINKGSPVVKKKLGEKIQMQNFRNKYTIEDEETLKVVEDCILKVKSKLKLNYPINDEELRKVIIDYAIKQNPLLEPSRYQDVLKQNEVNKIINRLNAGNIDENNIDFIKNKQFIKSKMVNGKKVYYTDSFNFTKEELEECSKYIAYQTVIKMFNGAVMPYVKQLPATITDNILRTINIEFNDENYVFNENVIDRLGIIDATEIFAYSEEIAKLPKDIRDRLYKILFEEDLYMFIIADSLINYGSDIYIYEEKDENGFIINLIENIARLPSIINIDEINISNYSKIKKYMAILQSLSNDDIIKLGPTLINMTVDNNAFNPRGLTTVEKLKRTNSLYDRMITKTNFTVPRTKGKYNQIGFEVMKQDDPHFLTCGFETDACFRVGGHDNDFLHYCALNKNGFVIKLSDSKGNFLGRASGFRNGNAIYLNQLRTIYDKSGNKTKHIPQEFKLELINALKACTDQIIRESSQSKEPIDYAIINHAYSLEEYDVDMFGVKVDSDVQFDLSDPPLQTKTEDWLEFRQTEGVDLREAEEKLVFDTDYPNYDKVVLSARDPKKTLITRTDLVSYDPQAVYTIKPEERQITTLTNENYEYFDSINKRNAAINREEYVPIDRNLIGCYVYYTSDWFILEGEYGLIGDSYDHRKSFPDPELLSHYTY